MRKHPLTECIGSRVRRASDKCLKEKRKTINGDDLLCAMSTLGFEDYVEPLKLYLTKFREVGLWGLAACTSRTCGAWMHGD
jgi:hypothetical protein